MWFVRRIQRLPFLLFYLFLIILFLAGSVAQSVERWTPRGERTRTGKKGLGFEARRALDVSEPPGGYGYGWWQAVAR